MSEQWRPIPSLPDYEVSDQGRVLTRKGAPRIRKASANVVNGYLYVTLRGPSGERITRHVHRLVLLAFVGPKPDDMESRHLNGNRTDNRLVNLAYGTRSENMRDKARHGTRNGPPPSRFCRRGHEKTGDNLYVSPKGFRYCRACWALTRKSNARDGLTVAS